jgi:hypothetical protein
MSRCADPGAGAINSAAALSRISRNRRRAFGVRRIFRASVRNAIIATVE